MLEGIDLFRQADQIRPKREEAGMRSALSSSSWQTMAFDMNRGMGLFIFQEFKISSICCQTAGAVILQLQVIGNHIHGDVTRYALRLHGIIRQQAGAFRKKKNSLFFFQTLVNQLMEAQHVLKAPESDIAFPSVFLRQTGWWSARRTEDRILFKTLGSCYPAVWR